MIYDIVYSFNTFFWCKYYFMMFCAQELCNLENYKNSKTPNSSNTDGSFTMTKSDSFLSPCEVLPIAQENKYLRKFSNFIMKLYVVCTH